MKALALDNNLAEAHAVLGASLLLFDWDFVGAEREYKQALALEPNSVIHTGYSIYLSILGRHQEAIAEAKRALQLEPLTNATNVYLGLAYLQARQYDQVIEQFRKVEEMDRGFSGAPNLCSAYLGKGQYKEAIATAQESLKTRPDSSGMLSYLARAYIKTGQREEAQKILNQVLTLAKQRDGPATSIALIFAELGDKDQAFAWLGKSYDARSSDLLYLKVSHQYDSLRTDPRFADLVRRVGIP